MNNNKSSELFVIMPTSTKYKRMIFGKNSGNYNGNVQEIVYFERKKFQNEKQKCTFIEIDPIKNETCSIIISKPTSCWGAEMGSNEFNVCIGNTLIPNKLTCKTENVDQNDKLTGSDLVRLALEYSTNAMEAVDVIILLLQKYGQQSINGYSNSFLIIDPNTVLIMETIDNEFIVEKISTESKKFFHLSNYLTIGKNFLKISDNLKKLAIDNNLWTGDDSGDDFNFEKIFNIDSDGDGGKSKQSILEEYTRDNNFDVKSMMKLLRDKNNGICHSFDESNATISSQVSILSPLESKCKSIHWFTGTPDTEYSYYKPFIFHMKVKKTSDKIMINNGDDGDLKHYLYKKHEQYLKQSHDDNELHKILLHIENVCIDELEQMFINCNDSNDGDLNDIEIDNLFSDSVESELRFYR